MELNLKGRTVLVTGGSKGIGLSVGRWFAAEGCNIRLVARSKDQLEAAAAELRQTYPVDIQTFAEDMSNATARDRVIAACPDIDILINNAGAIPGGALDEIDDATWRAAWDLKVFGYINLTRAYLTVMKQRRRGVIINIIGAAGERLDYSYIAGSMGNASLMAFTKALGGATPDFNVRVLGVNPGPVDTERVERLARKRAAKSLGDENRWQELFKGMPFGRPATCDEISATVVFLASDLSSYTTGAIINVDGGLSSRGAIP
jgi:NAD(P)-dependent dehydrogenase (short-subunit alcohol dehydrogenase family)